MARPRHPNKEIEEAVQYAEGRGWRVLIGGAHAWGFLYCREQSRAGCRVPVFSTPRNPESHAQRIQRKISGCPHQG